mgnify:CR=1 FL=1
MPQPKPNRHQQRKAATRQTLLEAAREVIVDRGYNEVEILDITERANVSKATFYKHFPNKEAVVREIMLAGFDALVKRIFEGGRRAEVREEWVAESFRDAFTWAAENRELLLIMVGGRASGQLGAFGRSYLVQHIERGFDEFGLFAETDDGVPRSLKAHVIAGALIQVLGWWLESDTGYSPSEIADLLQRVLVNGLGPLTR